uniref:Uncharacterized protein n=1 Tax=Arundo donax TaxID=35708 RepID=A0A0A9GZ66_ARUDO
MGVSYCPSGRGIHLPQPCEKGWVVTQHYCGFPKLALNSKTGCSRPVSQDRTFSLSKEHYVVVTLLLASLG